MKKSSAGFTGIYILIGLVILALVGGAYYFGKNSNTAVKDTTVITSTPTPTPTITPKVDETANWKTYTNNELTYQFKYPGDWAVDTNKSNTSTTKHLVIGFITSAQQGLMGVSYCGAHPEDKARCESLKINDSVVAGIDWGASQDDGANVIISHPKGGAVSFYLTPVSSENKKIFYQILATFKFLPASPSQGGDSNTVSGKYTCPENGYQNCMPILDAEGQKQCSKEALDWKKANCPNFTGAAY